MDAETLHTNEPLKDLTLRKNVLIASIMHGGKTVIPDGNSSFAPGDSVIVVSNGSNRIYQLNDIFA